MKQFDFSVDASPAVQTFVASCDGFDKVIAGTFHNLAYNTNLFSSHKMGDFGGLDPDNLDQFFSATLVVEVVDEVRIIITCVHLAQ